MRNFGKREFGEPKSSWGHAEQVGEPPLGPPFEPPILKGNSAKLGAL